MDETQVFDKPKVLRAHLDTAVILVALEDSYISAHTILMAAEEILRTWYVKKNVFWAYDYRILIKDEYHKRYIDKIREKYNFFKHADRDIDASLEVNPNEMHDLNEIMLAMNISGYQHIFGDISKAASTYFRWFIVCYPDLMKWDEFPNSAHLQTQISALRLDDPASKRQVLRALLYSEGVLPREDLALIRLAGIG